jgi:hypothetical protein
MSTTAITTSQATLCDLFAATAAERRDDLALRTAGGGINLSSADYAYQGARRRRADPDDEAEAEADRGKVYDRDRKPIRWNVRGPC